jgi:hypothetical protein
MNGQEFAKLMASVAETSTEQDHQILNMIEQEVNELGGYESLNEERKATYIDILTAFSRNRKH